MRLTCEQRADRVNGVVAIEVFMTKASKCGGLLIDDFGTSPSAPEMLRRPVLQEKEGRFFAVADAHPPTRKRSE